MTPSSRSGFTLIETGIVLVISSLLLVGITEAVKVYQKKTMMDTTKQRMIDIKAALAKFQAKNGRLPCPAILHDGTTAATFGVEACTAGPTDPKQVNGTTAGSKVRIGAVPVTTLGLSSDHITDYWGWRYIYAASEPLTVTGAPDPEYGEITLDNAAGVTVGGPTYAGHTPYVLFSLGHDGGGAVTLQGINSPHGCPPTGPEHENCKMTDSKFSDAPYSNTPNPATRFTQIMGNSLSSTDPAALCGNKGMLYGPAHPTADKDGCLPDLKVGDLSDATTANDGNVGIGTPTPVAKLDVRGRINARVDDPLTTGNGVQSFTHVTDPALFRDPANTGHESPFMSYSGIIGRSGETPQDRLWTGYDFDSSTTATGFVGGRIAAQFPQLGSNNMNTNLLFLNQGPGGFTEKMRIDSAGNTGIGTATPATKLDVAGELKIGNTGTACTTATAGAIRYNPTSKTQEFCDGTAWTPISGGGKYVGSCSASPASSCKCNAAETIMLPSANPFNTTGTVTNQGTTSVAGTNDPGSQFSLPYACFAGGPGAGSGGAGPSLPPAGCKPEEVLTSTDGSSFSCVTAPCIKGLVLNGKCVPNGTTISCSTYGNYGGYGARIYSTSYAQITGNMIFTKTVMPAGAPSTGWVFGNSAFSYVYDSTGGGNTGAFMANPTTTITPTGIIGTAIDDLVGTLTCSANWP